jgi:hypothetical protein
VIAVPQTPNSSPVSYLSVDEFIILKDVRALGQLSNDQGLQEDQAQLELNARIEAVLMAASGEIEAHLMGAGRYNSSDLSTPNGASEQFLKLVCADLALYHLYTSRDGPEPPASVLASYDRSQEYLRQLGTGEMILAFAETEAAGTPEDYSLTMADFQHLNRFTDQCQRVLGIRSEERRPF